MTKYCCQLLLHQRFRRTIVATNKRHNDFDEHLLLPTSSSNLCCRPSESLELQNSMIQQDALCNYKVHSWKCSAITLLDLRIQFICVAMERDLSLHTSLVIAPRFKTPVLVVEMLLIQKMVELLASAVAATYWWMCPSSFTGGATAVQYIRSTTHAADQPPRSWSRSTKNLST